MSFPDIPNAHALSVLLLTGLALFLFTRDRIPLETSSLFVLCLMALGFQQFPYDVGGQMLNPLDFFRGFSHPALIAVCALMIIGQALVRTGALEPVGRWLARLWRLNPTLSFLATLFIGAALSAFVNNTPIVVLMLPILMNVGVRTGQPVAGTLLPIGLATLIGGTSTTIGTSTNLLVVSVAADIGVEPFGMFDFMPVVAVAGVVAILYLWLIAPRLLPDRQPPLQDTGSRIFTAQLEIPSSSPVVGETLAAAIGRTEGMRVQRIQRGENLFITTLPDVILQAGDRLSVTDTPDQLRDYQHALKARLFSGEKRLEDDQPITAGEQKMAEVVVMMGSALNGVRVGEARLRSKYRLTLLAVHHAGQVERARSPGLEQRTLRAGDVLLVQGSEVAIEAVKQSGDLLVLDGTAELPHTSRAPLALLVLSLVVAMAATGLLPIALSAMLGVVALILTGTLSWRDASRGLSVQVIMIVVASLALGDALMRTGGADYMAQVFVYLTSGFAPAFVLAGLILLMTLMTNVVSNNAAAVIGTPIAISIAQRLGLPVEPFVLAVIFGANMSYATPMAYQTNLLVMNAGGYKFNDFIRVGVPMTLIMWVCLTALLTWQYRLW
ncbi:MAG: membrane protein [Lysobacteraceae bacterium]|nr:MAG: membrane protein [Xanthomonadaceae bacterium]